MNADLVISSSTDPWEAEPSVAQPAARVRVGIVDDHAIVRAGLRQFLSDHEGIRIVGEAGSGREAVELVRAVEMDVLLLDLSMPGQSGIDAMAMIRAKAPDVAVLVLSGYPEEQYAINLLRHGASGYLNKECEPLQIVDAIRTVASGRRYLSPVVAELIAQQMGPIRKREQPHECLSDREFQIFLKLAKGDAVRQIGNDLSLSPKTVSTYRTRIMEKMELVSNSELTYYALKNRLLS